MTTTTLRLGLTKQDVNDTYNISSMVNTNADLLDNDIGFLACTSSTRPSSPFSGQAIQETDTGRYYVSNGTAPLSASWVQLLGVGADISLNNHSLFITGGNISMTGTGSNLTVGGSASIAGNMTVGGTLTVSKTVTISGGTSNLSVGGSASFGGNLTISGTGSNLSVGGSASIGGNLTVGGRITGITNLSAAASATLSTTNVIADCPGAFVNITTSKANTVAVIIGVFDFSSGTAGTADTGTGILNFNGVDNTTQVALFNINTTVARTQGVQVWTQLIATPGTYQARLRAKNAGAGVAINVNGGSGTATSITAIVFDI